MSMVQDVFAFREAGEERTIKWESVTISNLATTDTFDTYMRNHEIASDARGGSKTWSWMQELIALLASRIMCSSAFALPLFKYGEKNGLAISGIWGICTAMYYSPHLPFRHMHSPNAIRARTRMQMTRGTWCGFPPRLHAAAKRCSMVALLDGVAVCPTHGEDSIVCGLLDGLTVDVVLTVLEDWGIKGAPSSTSSNIETTSEEWLCSSLKLLDRLLTIIVCHPLYQTQLSTTVSRVGAATIANESPDRDITPDHQQRHSLDRTDTGSGTPATNGENQHGSGATC